MLTSTLALVALQAAPAGAGPDPDAGVAATPSSALDAARGDADAAAADPGGASAPGADDIETVEEVETIEDIDAIEVVDPATVSSPGELTATALIGRLHPLTVHLPVGWLLLLALVDLVTFIRGKVSWARAGQLLLLATTLSTLPAVATGLLRAEAVTGNAELVLQHRNLALILTGLCVAALALRLWRRNHLVGVFKLLYLLIVLGSVGVLLVTGHLGGTLVFGEAYLPF